MAIGEEQKMPAAFIVPAFEFVTKWAKEKGITLSSNQELIENPKVIARIQEEIEKYNASFGNWEQIKKFELLPAEFTVETGELTPTLKFKRKIIMGNYKSTFEKIYN